MRVDVEALAPSGAGLAHIDGVEIHIAGAVPGDVLDITVEHRSPHRPVAWARIDHVVERGPDAVDPICPHAAPLRGRCGGCALGHLAPTLERQLAIAAVERAFASHTALDPPELDMHDAPARLHWRNRTNHVVGRVDGRPVLGSWAPRSHELVPMPGCVVVRPSIAEVADRIPALLERLAIPVADESSAALRYVTIRGNDAGEVLVEWIARTASPLWCRPLAAALSSAMPSVVGQVASVNDRSGNAIRGEEPCSVTGRATLVERVGDLELEVTPSAFLQLNSDVAAEMYALAGQRVARACAGRTQPVVWDLYCGVGGLGLAVASALRMAGNPPRLFACEWVPDAVAAAAKNASRNGLDADVIVHDCRDGWPDAWPRPDAVLVNPPRRGLSAELRSQLNALPAHVAVVYMSCNPDTLARDAAEIVGEHRRLTTLDAWNMLPRTRHVEVLAAFGPR